MAYCNAIAQTTCKLPIFLRILAYLSKGFEEIKKLQYAKIYPYLHFFHRINL